MWQGADHPLPGPCPPGPRRLAAPGQGVVPSLSLGGSQSLGEVSIHKTVMPPRTLSPPLCPSLCRTATAQGPPSSLLGHPREGQSASLLGGKYILLDELEGSTLHRCLDINSHEELVCKVRDLSDINQRPAADPA